jgi:hypothetical protein
VYLLEQAVGSGPILQAYLCYSQSQQQVRIYCIHLPTKFTSSLTGDVTPWDGNIFAFLGKVRQGIVTMVQLPNTFFCTVNYVQVMTSDYMITHLAELTPHSFPPCQDDDNKDTNLVTTRQIMYLSPRYVPLFLNPAGYTLS